MGMSIDYIANKWEKKEVFFKRLKVSDGFVRNSDNESVFASYLDKMDNNDLLYMEESEMNNIKEKRFDYYMKKTSSFIESIRENEDSLLKEWLLSHKDALISFNEDGFHASYELESYSKHLWRPTEFIPIEEDGMLLVRAISNLDNLYGVSLSFSMLSLDWLEDYDEGSQIEAEITQTITESKKFLADILEFALENMKKLPNDSFFEERLPRIQFLLKALQANGVFVYSV